MINKVNQSPAVAQPTSIATLQGINGYISVFFQTLMVELQAHATVINSLADNSNAPTSPIMLPIFVKTALPAAAGFQGSMIYVSNDVGGGTPAFSDGSSWRRTADRNVIS